MRERNQHCSDCPDCKKKSCEEYLWASRNQPTPSTSGPYSLCEGDDAYQLGLEAGQKQGANQQEEILQMITDAFTGRTPVMSPVPIEVQDIIVRIRSIGEVSYQRGWEARGVHDAKER